MDTYSLILLIAMPIFVVLIIIEMIFYKIQHREYFEIDAIASLYSGMTNTLKDVLGLTIVIVSYPVLLHHLALIEWGSSGIITYVLAFLIFDFGGYWYHRLSHRVNYFWNLHIIHHSSEEYNLPCALRQQFSVITNFLSILCYGLMMAVLGIPVEVYTIVAPVHLFMQFWYHTRLIGKMGLLEKILVTPSHHRVHHAMNDIYLDKNYSQIFIIWDKLFGTFQEELDTEKPVYGVRRPVRTWNPILINFQHFWVLLKDAVLTTNWVDKIKVWFMPTGWRPKDMEEKYPLYYVKDIGSFQKFHPGYSKAFVAWNQIHLIASFALMSFLFYNISNLQDNYQYLYYGLFLLFSIFSFTTLMDKKKSGPIMEVMKAILAVYIVLTTQDWFGLNQYWSIGSWVVLSYFILAAVAAVYFYFTEFRKKDLQLNVI